jgi:hypothetical protein
MTSPDQLFVMERRRFLVLGSAAAVAFAARGVSAAPMTGANELPASLAVGYVDGLDGHTAAIGANSVTAGDPSFLSRSAQVTVLGMWRSTNRREPVGVTLKAYYPTIAAVGGDVPVYAWNHVSRGAGDQQQSSRFRVPIDDAGLRLEVEASPLSSKSAIIESLRSRVTMDSGESRPRPRAAIAQLPTVASLSIGIDRGAAKLLPGTYVLAMLPAGASTPDWTNVRYTPSNISSAAGPITTRAILGETAAPFDYVVINVDFAS